MSANGVRIEDTDLELAEGLLIHIEFSLFPSSSRLRLQCEVVRITKTGGFGACFHNTPPRTRARIRAVLPQVGSSRIREDEDDTTYSGTLVANLGPDLQRDCALAAEVQGLTLDSWLQQRLREVAAHDLEKARSHDPQDGACPCSSCRSASLH